MVIMPPVQDTAAILNLLRVIADPDKSKQYMSDLVSKFEETAKLIEENKQLLAELDQKQKNVEKNLQVVSNSEYSLSMAKSKFEDEVKVRESELDNRERKISLKESELLEQSKIDKDLLAREYLLKDKQKDLDFTAKELNNIKASLEDRENKIKAQEDKLTQARAALANFTGLING